MPLVRKVTITQKPSAQRQYPDAEAPASWIVKLDGQEFVHGHHHALPFDSCEDAARFAADLLAEYGAETSIELVGLDELGLPLPPPHHELPKTIEEYEQWCGELEQIEPRVTCHKDRTLKLVAKAIFTEAPAKHKIDLIIQLMGNYLRQRDVSLLRSLEPAFAVAAYKRSIPANYLEYAELEVALSYFRQSYLNE